MLTERRSVCEGFARLYEAVGKDCGLQVEHIAGQVKGLGYRLGLPQAKASHAWNAVKIDGKWELLDVTWGAGATIGNDWQRRFTEHYFLTPPAEFVYDHFPEDPKWQLLDPPLTWDDYDRLVFLRSDFFRCGLGLDSHKAAQITAENSVTITFTGPEGVELLASLRSDFGAPLTGDWTLCQRAGDKYQVLVRWPEPGKYRLTGIRETARRIHPGRGSRPLHHRTPPAPPPPNSPSSARISPTATPPSASPTESVLQAGKPYTFTITVPGAREATRQPPRPIPTPHQTRRRLYRRDHPHARAGNDPGGFGFDGGVRGQVSLQLALTFTLQICIINADLQTECAMPPRYLSRTLEPILLRRPANSRSSCLLARASPARPPFFDICSGILIATFPWNPPTFALRRPAIHTGSLPSIPLR